MGVKYSLFLRWGTTIVGENFDRWGSICYISLLFSISIFTQKCQNIILGHLRTVNGELCRSYREKISFKLKYDIKTWLQIFKNRYHGKQIHINETNDQHMRISTSDRDEHMSTKSIETDKFQ